MHKRISLSSKKRNYKTAGSTKSKTRRLRLSDMEKPLVGIIKINNNIGPYKPRNSL